jgi:hypothetical protein
MTHSEARKSFMRLGFYEPTTVLEYPPAEILNGFEGEVFGKTRKCSNAAIHAIAGRRN